MLKLEDFGQYIRSLRVEKDLTQQQLADLMFVSRKTIGNWETGARLPDISMLSRLARHLGVETYELLDAMYGEDEPPVVIVVEKEPDILKSFVQLIIDTLPEAQVFGFDAMSEALSFASGHRPAMAFINVEQLGEVGLNFARTLTSIYPKINIIFMARDLDNADKAVTLRASGYVILPLTAEKIRQEVAHLRYPVRGLA